jgi:predicted RNA-binding Zn ribbon-like protein
MSTFSIETTEGWLCLDFANTLEQDTAGNDVEMLNGYGDLLAWAHALWVISDDEAAHLAAAEDTHAASDALVHAIDLRGALFRIFRAHTADASPEEADLATLNHWLGATAHKRRLVFMDSGYEWTWQPAGDDLTHVLGPVAWSAAGLLRSSQLGRVRECANELCQYLFVDTSRNRSRRWCSMEGCGNRVKVKRYIKRHNHT